MRNMIPCPSPRGTNVERLFLVRRPHLAMDAALEEPGAAPDAFADLCTFLEENLSPDVLGEAHALLRQFIDKSGGGNLAADEPPPFSGRPSPGAAQDPRTPAMDARLAVAADVRRGRRYAERFLFNERFPGAARIRTV